jgi:hypothetical protein
MNKDAAELIVAWLKREDGPPRVSLLGIFFAPAKWIGYHLHGGVYITGQLRLTPNALAFEPDRMRAKFHRGQLSWSLTLSEIEDVVYVPGRLMGTIEVRYAGGSHKMKCATGGEAFVEALNKARGV